VGNLPVSPKIIATSLTLDMYDARRTPQINKLKTTMDSQTAFNILLSLVAFLGGYVLKTFNDSIKTLQQKDSELADKVQSIQVLVAGQYVKRDDMEKLIDKLSSALFTKLDKIDSKLDSKADK